MVSNRLPTLARRLTGSPVGQLVLSKRQYGLLTLSHTFSSTNDRTVHEVLFHQRWGVVSRLGPRRFASYNPPDRLLQQELLLLLQ